MQPESPLLSVEGLDVVFRSPERTVHAVKKVSYHVNAGEVVALVGESGSGKSVSALSCLRLIPAPPATYPSGRILWKGENVLGMNADRLQQLRGGEISVIFQEPMTALNPLHTIGDQIAEVLELHRPDLDVAARGKRVLALMEEVGIREVERRAQQFPHELSGGMRQRICIAIALASDPELLIADEPTTALDVTIQAQIIDLLMELNAKRKMAMLFITHDLGVVAEIAHRVVILWRGEKVEEGLTTDIFAKAQHSYTKGLIACRPVLGKRLDRLPTLEDFLGPEG
jgi:microcin C transport system ATP-binding protein